MNEETEETKAKTRTRTYEELDKFINQVNRFREAQGTDLFIDEIFIKSVIIQDSESFLAPEIYIEQKDGKEIEKQVHIQIRFVKYFMTTTTPNQNHELKWESRIERIKLAPKQTDQNDNAIPLTHEEKQEIVDNMVRRLITQTQSKISMNQEKGIVFNLGTDEIK